MKRLFLLLLCSTLACGGNQLSAADLASPDGLASAADLASASDTASAADMASTASAADMPSAASAADMASASDLASAADTASASDLASNSDLWSPSDLASAPAADLLPATDLLPSLPLLTSSFGGANGLAWPAPWTTLGGVAAGDQQSGRGRLRPTLSGYSLARVGAPLPSSPPDVNVRVKIRFADLSTSGIGLYVRQNGGYLQDTATHGQGYAVFVEGFRGFQGIGLWREVNGNEQELLHTTLAGLASNQDFWVRFVVEQENPTTTRLRARLWADGAAEPSTWQIEASDTTASLQNVSGGLACDGWSSYTSASGTVAADVFFDELTVRAAP